MPYFVQIGAANRAYLDSLPLSEMAKGKVDDFIEYAIAQVEDAVRNDPANRIQPGTRYFHRDLLLLDFWGDRQFHRIDFVINDENAPIGVLIIVYVEHQ